jgi:hypothetical protein
VLGGDADHAGPTHPAVCGSCAPAAPSPYLSPLSPLPYLAPLAPPPPSFPRQITAICATALLLMGALAPSWMPYVAMTAAARVLLWLALYKPEAPHKARAGPTWGVCVDHVRPLGVCVDASQAAPAARRAT